MTGIERVLRLIRRLMLECARNIADVHGLVCVFLLVMRGRRYTLKGARDILQELLCNCFCIGGIFFVFVREGEPHLLVATGRACRKRRADRRGSRGNRERMLSRTTRASLD